MYVVIYYIPSNCQNVSTNSKYLHYSPYIGIHTMLRSFGIGLLVINYHNIIMIIINEYVLVVYYNPI